MSAFGGVYLEVGTSEDVAACRDFYRDLLGLTLTEEVDDESAWFATDGMTFGFHTGEGPARESRSAVNVVLRTGSAVTIDDEAERLVDAGLQLLMKPTDMPWGRVITFLDPAGHAVWLVQS